MRPHRPNRPEVHSLDACSRNVVCTFLDPAFVPTASEINWFQKLFSEIFVNQRTTYFANDAIVNESLLGGFLLLGRTVTLLFLSFRRFLLRLCL